MSAYSEKLKDPRWIAKRDRILERDEYACVFCGKNPERDGIQLQVHHIVYRGEPWEIEDEMCITLCEHHHEQVTHLYKKTRLYLTSEDAAFRLDALLKEPLNLDYSLAQTVMERALVINSYVTIGMQLEFAIKCLAFEELGELDAPRVKIEDNGLLIFVKGSTEASIPELKMDHWFNVRKILEWIQWCREEYERDVRDGTVEQNWKLIE